MAFGQNGETIDLDSWEEEFAEEILPQEVAMEESAESDVEGPPPLTTDSFELHFLVGTDIYEGMSEELKQELNAFFNQEVRRIYYVKNGSALQSRPISVKSSEIDYYDKIEEYRERDLKRLTEKLESIKVFDEYQDENKQHLIRQFYEKLLLYGRLIRHRLYHLESADPYGEDLYKIELDKIYDLYSDSLENDGTLALGILHYFSHQGPHWSSLRQMQAEEIAAAEAKEERRQEAIAAGLDPEAEVKPEPEYRVQPNSGLTGLNHNDLIEVELVEFHSGSLRDGLFRNGDKLKPTLNIQLLINGQTYDIPVKQQSSGEPTARTVSNRAEIDFYIPETRDTTYTFPVEGSARKGDWHKVTLRGQDINEAVNQAGVLDDTYDPSNGLAGLRFSVWESDSGLFNSNDQVGIHDTYFGNIYYRDTFTDERALNLTPKPQDYKRLTDEQSQLLNNYFFTKAYDPYYVIYGRSLKWPRQIQLQRQGDAEREEKVLARRAFDLNKLHEHFNNEIPNWHLLDGAYQNELVLKMYDEMIRVGDKIRKEFEKNHSGKDRDEIQEIYKKAFANAGKDYLDSVQKVYEVYDDELLWPFFEANPRTDEEVREHFILGKIMPDLWAEHRKRHSMLERDQVTRNHLHTPFTDFIDDEFDIYRFDKYRENRLPDCGNFRGIDIDRSNYYYEDDYTQIIYIKNCKSNAWAKFKVTVKPEEISYRDLYAQKLQELWAQAEAEMDEMNHPESIETEANESNKVDDSSRSAATATASENQTSSQNLPEGAAVEK